MNHASDAVAPPHAEVVQAGDAIWQRARARSPRCRKSGSVRMAKPATWIRVVAVTMKVVGAVARVRVSGSWSRGCSSRSAFLLRRARAASLSRHAARPGLAQTTGISGVIGGRRGGVLDVTLGSRMSW
jgi:hypothetical protein